MARRSIDIPEAYSTRNDLDSQMGQSYSDWYAMQHEMEIDSTGESQAVFSATVATANPEINSDTDLTFGLNTLMARMPSGVLWVFEGAPSVTLDTLPLPALNSAALIKYFGVDIAVIGAAPIGTMPAAPVSLRVSFQFPEGPWTAIEKTTRNVNEMITCALNTGYFSPPGSTGV